MGGIPGVEKENLGLVGLGLGLGYYRYVSHPVWSDRFWQLPSWKQVPKEPHIHASTALKTLHPFLWP